MINSKILLSIEMFSRVELTRLKDFVRSPYYNKHSKVMELMDYIYDIHPDLSSPRLRNEKVYKRLYPGEKYNSKRLAHTMSYLQNLIEEFLSIEAYNKELFLKRHLNIQKTKGKATSNLYEQKLMKFARHFEKQQRNDTLQYYHQSLIESELDHFYLNRKKKPETNYLQAKSDSFDLFYLSSKLEYWCDMMNRSNVLNINYDYPFLKEVEKVLSKNGDNYLKTPIISIYYRILLTLKYPEQQSNYYKLKKLLLNHVNDFEKDNIKTMFDYAQNYCIKRINKGDKGFLKELLELYKLMIEKKLIFENNIFPSSDFKNIVTIASRLKEYNWTENFIHQYKHTLEKKNSEHIFKYNLASLHYERKQHDLALKLLRDVEFTDTYYALGARSMLMKIYYEIGESDPLAFHFDAFRTYLRRNKVVSAYQKKAHLNFIKFTKQTYLLKMKSDWERKSILRTQAKKILERIKNTEEITNKSWIEQQVLEFV